MRIIDLNHPRDGESMKPPGWCVFTHDIDGPFVDTERHINEIDPWGYVSVRFVEDMGRVVGMVPKHEFDALAHRLETLEVEFLQVSAALEAIEKVEPALLGVSNGSA